ncbi:MAG: PP2C family serine/threonine-protein phosphatase [Planctomycetota bacterium]|jgi:hypothetical protein
MWVCVQEFHTPKKGSSEAEYEDAFFPGPCFHRGVGRFRCAVADGASESAFAREWAQLLVRNFGRGRFHLDYLQRLWKKLVQKRKLPWYLQAKVAKGAHAALVGLSIGDGEARGWRALAIGDSCLFHVRDQKLLVVGPVARSADFDNSPFLLSTKCPAPIPRGAPHVHVMSGTWQPKDAFYLASDALAQWVLAEEEAGRPPWKTLCELGTKAQVQPFDSLVDGLRSANQLHNDDTTLLRLEVV